MNIMTKTACLIVGWNPGVLRNCSQNSYAMLKKYMAAITIMSIIWGVIGWCFADNYLGIKSWYGKLLTAVSFIAVVVCIERYIILTSRKDLHIVRFFRIFLAVLMAVLGSTIFDQIVFKNDIKAITEVIKTERGRVELSKRVLLIDCEIQNLSRITDSINNANQVLYEAISKQPTVKISEITTTTRQTGVDENGQPVIERDRTVTQKNVPNPKIEQAEKNEDLLKEYRKREQELQNIKLNLEPEIQKKYEQMPTGFLEELGALYSLLGSNWMVRMFYIFLFLFLTCLELLVITTKGGKTDYELLLEFQLEQREKELDILKKN